MSDKLRDTVQLAITRASANYPPQQWHELPSSHRTREIYRELRELDAAALRRLQERYRSGRARSDAEVSISRRDLGGGYLLNSACHSISAKSERARALTACPVWRAHSSSSPGMYDHFHDSLVACAHAIARDARRFAPHRERLGQPVVVKISMLSVLALQQPWHYLHHSELPPQACAAVCRYLRFVRSTFRWRQIRNEFRSPHRGWHFNLGSRRLRRRETRHSCRG